MPIFDSNTLYTQLPIEVANALRQPINDTIALGNTTANDLFSSLKYELTDSPFFKVFRNFLTGLFGETGQTIAIDNAIYIGNGLRLTDNPQTKTLFLTLFPQRQWDFNQLFNETGYPAKPLAAGEIKLLTAWSLLGIENQNGNFSGYMPRLMNDIPNLVGQSFNTTQLFGLLATNYITNLPLPNNLEQALLYQAPDVSLEGMVPLMSIMEYANPAQNVVFANLLLAAGAMFHGKPEEKFLDVHQTHRNMGRILAANTNKKIVSAPTRWGLPSGNLEDNFVGFNQSVTIPSFNPNVALDDSIIFGTPGNDVLNNTGSGSPVYISGNGKDRHIFNFDASNATSAFHPYMSGQGANIHHLKNQGPVPAQPLAMNLFVRDGVDGRIHTNYPSDAILGGPLVDEQILLGREIYEIAIVEQEINGNYTMVLEAPTQGSLTLANYQPGKYGFLPGGFTHKISNCSAIGRLNNQGKLAYICLQDVGTNPNVYIYDVNTQKTNVMFVAGIAPWFTWDFAATPEGNFYLYGLSDNGNGTYTFSYVKIDPTSVIKTNALTDVNVITTQAGSTATMVGLTDNNVAFFYYEANAQKTWDVKLGYINDFNATKTLWTVPDQTMSAWPYAINDGGLVIQRSNNNEPMSLYFIDDQGNIINNITSPAQAYFCALVPLKKGFLVDMPYDWGQNNTLVRYGNGTWTNVQSVASECARGGSRFGLLPDQRALFLQPDGASSIIVNHNTSQLILGPFGCYLDLVWDTAVGLSNGDAVAKGFYSDTGDDVVVVHKTSYLWSENQFSNVEIQEINDKIPAEKSQPIITPVANDALVAVQANNIVKKMVYPEEMSFGWRDDAIETDPLTNEPIFTYEAYDQHNAMIGTMKFYGQRLLCRGEQGGNNIIETTGIFNKLELTKAMAPEAICRVLPPSMFDRVLASAGDAAGQGFLRGSMNVIGFTLKTRGTSEQMANFISQSLYYGTMFTMRFYDYCSQLDAAAEGTAYLQAAFNAAKDTAFFGMTNFVLTQASRFFSLASDELNKNQWTRLSKVAKFAEKAIPFSFFPTVAARQGVVPAAAALVAGATAQIATEEIGKTVVESYSK